MGDAGQKGKGVGLQDSLVAIIFSAASLEAFIAEVPYLINIVANEYPSLKNLERYWMMQKTRRSR
jgi:hypothetical protein